MRKLYNELALDNFENMELALKAQGHELINYHNNTCKPDPQLETLITSR